MTGSTARLIALDLYLSPLPHAIIADDLTSIVRGELRVVLDQHFALADTGESHAYIESRKAFGRFVLIP
ncbi:MAG: zinc-binding dehydrogenase [Acidimicrobiales bacterium]|jgi:NADPH:quinone reductase-like Zn-dependent oxidoreductase